MELTMPEPLIDGTSRFASNHVYMATADHLPSRPIVEHDVVLVCIGDGPRLAYYREHATVILVQKDADFFEVYRTLCQIYGLFQDWQARLLELLVGPADVRDILDCSLPIFERPLYVLDDAFDFVASTLPAHATERRRSEHALDPSDFLAYLREADVDMNRHGAFVPAVVEENVLCVNLFDAADEYIGCLFINVSDRPIAEGEDKLAEYLAHIVERAEEANPSLAKGDRTSLREIFGLMIEGRPLSQNQNLLVQSLNGKSRYLCLSIHYLQRFSTLPINYVCSMFETLLPGSVLFEQNGTIVGFAPLKDEQDITPEFAAYIEDMHLCMGVSNEFSDLYASRTYYEQAEAAIENGQLMKAGETVYRFSDFALFEMISNVLGSFPLDTYYPAGFDKLMEHDQKGGVSYIETLRVFLEENMSYAKAAKRLFIHRSTLVERMARIEDDLPLNLEDPDARLQLQLVLKALQVAGTITRLP